MSYTNGLSRYVPILACRLENKKKKLNKNLRIKANFCFFVQDIL